MGVLRSVQRVHAEIRLVDNVWLTELLLYPYQPKCYQPGMNMSDPETYTSAAALALGSAGRTPSFYGGGPPIGGHSDQLFLNFVRNYLMHHPFERSELANELRAVINGAHNVAYGGGPALPEFMTQGSYPSNALAIGHMVPGPAVYHCDYSLLDAHRSDVASLARFSQRVDHATWYLYVAIDGQIESKHWRTRGVTLRKGARTWYGALAKQCFGRWRSTRKILVADWSVPEESEALYRTAFWSLCELTPADNQLKALFEQDRLNACRELARHIDVYAEQLSLATDLAEAMEEDEGRAEASEDEVRREAIQTALLAKSGDPLTLTEAAERLGISRQAMHKKIKSGAALGLMKGDVFVVPSVQLVEGKGGWGVVPHLRKVLSLFGEAGAGTWSALQYLVEPDPALGGKVPIDILKARDVDKVVCGARGYLGLDED